ncbi:UNVERIFIED_CONTAM: hypothetical protein FKN15_047303 [Acipenser sinensis]
MSCSSGTATKAFKYQRREGNCSDHCCVPLYSASARNLSMSILVLWDKNTMIHLQKYRHQTVNRDHRKYCLSLLPEISAPQSSSVASAHSSDGESESLSESDSTSGSETESESSSSENEEEEEHEPKKSPPVPEPDAPTANKWQLDNWLVKVNQQCSHPESQSDPAQSHIEESRVQDSNGDNPEESLKSNESCPPHDESSRESRVIQDISHSKGSRQKSPAHRAGISQRQSVGKKQPCKSAKVPRPEECRGDLKVESEPAPPKGKDQSSTEKPKVKTKNGHEKPSKKTETGKPPKRVPSEKKKRKEPTATLKPALDSHCEREGRAVCSRLPQAESQPPSAVRTSADKAVNQEEDCLRKSGALTPIGDGRLLSPRRDDKAPQALVVKIQLSLLSRVPQPPGKGSHQKKTALPKPSVERKKEAGKLTLDSAPPKVHKKRQSASKKMKKVLVPPPVSPAQGPPKGAGYKRCSSESSSAGACNAKSSHVGPSSVKHKKTQQKHTEHSKSSKKSSQNSSTPFPVPSLPNESSKPARPLQKFDNKQYPVEHHIKEAKKLKHKADVMSDKVGKAFSYLDAALSFIESGISMESNPQTPKSAYTMFSETVDLIKSSGTPSPMSPMPSPASSAGSMPGSSLSKGGSTGMSVTIPQMINQVASSYISITSLFLTAHDIWEQADALAKKNNVTTLERWLPPHPMALCQRRLDNTPRRVASGSSLHGLPHLPLLLLHQGRRGRCSKRSTDSEQIEKLWAAVSHQESVLTELLRERSVRPVPLRPQGATGAEWPQEDILSIATSDEVGKQELAFPSEGIGVLNYLDDLSPATFYGWVLMDLAKSQLTPSQTASYLGVCLDTRSMLSTLSVGSAENSCLFGALSEFFVELDSAMGPLSLTTSMSALVRFTRQGLHWLRLDTNMP